MSRHKNLAKREYNGKKIAQACLKNSLTPYINNNDTTRDMDLLRAILGAEWLNYLGYFYKTWLGARYANLFPKRVNRMVLVGLTDITKRFETTFLRQPLARRSLLDEHLVPYALRHVDAFNLGTTKEKIIEALAGLETRLQHVLAGPLSALGYRRSSADTYLLNIKAS